MDRDLISEAEKLGGKVTITQGSIFMRRQTNDDPTKFWIVQFYFSSTEQLIELLTKAKASGFVPFDDVINLKVSGTGEQVFKQAPGPDDCPIHGVPLLPSKKKGFEFCPAQNADSSFCKFTRKMYHKPVT